jgi:hypothetical protein
MDLDKALAQLAKLAGAGKKAGDDTDAGAKKAQQGLEGVDAAAAAAARSMLALQGAQMALSAVQQAGAAIAQQFKETADYVKKLADDFAGLRRAMQELAALSDQPITNKFVIEQGKIAGKYGMTMEENRLAQEEFKNIAGAMVGDEKDEAGEPTGKVAAGAKLTTAQGTKLFGRVAQFMKSVGQKPELGMALVGAQLQQARGPQEVDKIMRDFVESYNIAQKGPVPVADMIKQLPGIMSYGMTAQEAAMGFNIVAPSGEAGQAGTSTQRAMDAIQKMKTSDKGLEFGVRKGMGQMEAIAAFATNIDDRRKNLIARGYTEQAAYDEIESLLADKGVVAERKEAKGLVRGFGLQGVQLGGFQQYMRILGETPADIEQAKIKEFAETPEGLAQAQEIRKEQARITAGEKLQPVRLERLRAGADVAEGGELEQAPGLARLIRTKMPFQTQTYEEQLENRQMLANVGRRARAAGIETPYDPSTRIGTAMIAVESMQNQLQINKDIKELLAKIEAHEAAQRQIAEQGAGKPGKPLDANMPAGNGARMAKP